MSKKTRAKAILLKDALALRMRNSDVTPKQLKETAAQFGIAPTSIDNWLYQDIEPPIIFLLIMLEIWPDYNVFDVIGVSGDTPPSYS